ncbi:Hypothetical predicted protein [Pelobates cultripes]|uniref:Uncharacterized protein n=1 Tax=Pelobates cultripes TaxID=61616 RepID=A0AAD1RFE7_PELCU|nr:Hypothetical predicted protein [Pelobates cultripes]
MAGEPSGPPKMAETMRPPVSHETLRHPSSNIDKIFPDFWLKLELRLQQGAPGPLISNCPPRQQPPNPQHRPAAQTGPHTVQRQRRNKPAPRPRRAVKQQKPSTGSPSPLITQRAPYLGPAALLTDPSYTRLPSYTRALTTSQWSPTRIHNEALHSPNAASGERPVTHQHHGPGAGGPGTSHNATS